MKSSLWVIFDHLRSENITSEDYDFILVLLSMYKDKILYNYTNLDKSDILSQIDIVLRERENNSKDIYINIYQIFKPTLNSISSNGLKSIIRVICNLDHRFLSENFPRLFDSVLYDLAKSQGRHGGEYIQPLEITRFISGIFELPKTARIFNPFAGLASFGVNLDKGLNYFGQEVNQKTWALGALRIMANERLDISRYECDDSILNWPHKSEYFDLVVANPPFGLRLHQQYREVEPGINTVEQFLIEKGVRSLNAKGKLIALLSEGILFRGVEQRLRERLINEDLIDTVISLPGGLLLNTGMPFIVLIIDKDKKRPGKVRFIDAKKFVHSKRSKENVLNDNGLISVIHGSYQDSDSVRVIDNSQIRNFDYNLSVPRYFQKHIEGVKLKEIVDCVRGRRGNLSDTGKMIRIRDLKDDKLDFILDISSVEETVLQRPNLRAIEESCVLLATRWKTLKPSYFEFSGESIFLNPDILAFKINEQLADTAYLLNELHSDYVEEQLASYRQGTAIPMIRRDDLLEVVIKLPSLEEQRAKVQGIVEASDKINSLQRERNALALGKEVNKFNEFASLKHTLGRPRQNILDWTDNLLHFLSDKREGFDALNKSFLNFYKTDILSALKEIKRDINFMTEVLEKGENGFIVEEYDKTIISLSDVNSLVNELSSHGFHFTIKKFLIKGEKLKERGIQGNIILLKTLIDNLLTNANKYGFDQKLAGNEVVFELKEIDEFLSVEVRNNGKPFPNNFDRGKFTTKYSTADTKSGSGLGGYDIHRIASEFNNPDWELILNMDPIYPVKFIFQFPIKLIN